MSQTLLERVTASLLDDDMLDRVMSSDHADHRLAPEFAAAGMHESPCMISRCTQHDPEHSDAFDTAEQRADTSFGGGGERHPHALDLSQPIHGFETHANPDHVEHLMNHPEAVKGPATVMKHKGKFHVMDGHHRIAAGLMRGDSHHPVNLIDLDEGK